MLFIERNDVRSCFFFNICKFSIRGVLCRTFIVTAICYVCIMSYKVYFTYTTTNNSFTNDKIHQLYKTWRPTLILYIGNSLGCTIVFKMPGYTATVPVAVFTVRLCHTTVYYLLVIADLYIYKIIYSRSVML